MKYILLTLFGVAVIVFFVVILAFAFIEISYSEPWRSLKVCNDWQMIECSDYIMFNDGNAYPIRDYSKYMERVDKYYGLHKTYEILAKQNHLLDLRIMALQDFLGRAEPYYFQMDKRLTEEFIYRNLLE